MRAKLQTAMVAAMIAFAALNASAEVASTALTHDPLMKQILSKQLTQPAGGVTGAVRIGSGQAITLNLLDPLSLASAQPLKDAVADAKALAGLQPAQGLAAKPVKAKARRKLRRADEQLKKMSSDERRADWTGRK